MEEEQESMEEEEGLGRRRSTSGRELLRHSVESAPAVQPEARAHRGLGGGLVFNYKKKF